MSESSPVTHEVDERTGALTATHTNGDMVRMHVSRFHGVIVCAGRTYLDGKRREVSAYFGDPQALADWLAREGYTAHTPTSPATKET